MHPCGGWVLMLAVCVPSILYRVCSQHSEWAVANSSLSLVTNGSLWAGFMIMWPLHCSSQSVVTWSGTPPSIFQKRPVEEGVHSECVASTFTTSSIRIQLFAPSGDAISSHGGLHRLPGCSRCPSSLTNSHLDPPTDLQDSGSHEDDDTCMKAWFVLHLVKGGVKQTSLPGLHLYHFRSLLPPANPVLRSS